MSRLDQLKDALASAVRVQASSKELHIHHSERPDTWVTLFSMAEEEGFDFAQYEGGTRWHALVCYT